MVATVDDELKERRFFSNINNFVSPWAGLNARLPFTSNPNFPNILATFQSCTSARNESGICTPASFCNFYGGRSSGTCSLGNICCVSRFHFSMPSACMYCESMLMVSTYTLYRCDEQVRWVNYTQQHVLGFTYFGKLVFYLWPHRSIGQLPARAKETHMSDQVISDGFNIANANSER